MVNQHCGGLCHPPVIVSDAWDGLQLPAKDKVLGRGNSLCCGKEIQTSIKAVVTLQVRSPISAEGPSLRIIVFLAKQHDERNREPFLEAAGSVRCLVEAIGPRRGAIGGCVPARIRCDGEPQVPWMTETDVAVDELPPRRVTEHDIRVGLCAPLIAKVLEEGFYRVEGTGVLGLQGTEIVVRGALNRSASNSGAYTRNP